MMVRIVDREGKQVMPFRPFPDLPAVGDTIIAPGGRFRVSGPTVWSLPDAKLGDHVAAQATLTVERED